METVLTNSAAEIVINLLTASKSAAVLRVPIGEGETSPFQVKLVQLPFTMLLIIFIKLFVIICCERIGNALQAHEKAHFFSPSVSFKLIETGHVIWDQFKTVRFPSPNRILTMRNSRLSLLRNAGVP